MYELKMYREVMCHGNEEWCKTEKLTGRFKIDTTIWQILTRALKCLEDLHFNGLLLTKVYNVWAKKAQNSYVWFTGWKIAISF